MIIVVRTTITITIVIVHHHTHHHNHYRRHRKTSASSPVAWCRMQTSPLQWRSMHPSYPVATPGQVTTYSIVTTTLQCQNCLSFPAASAHHPLSKRLHLQPRFLQLHIGKSHRKSRCPNGSSSPNGSSMEKAPVPDFQSQSSRSRHPSQPRQPTATESQPPPPKATPSHRHHRLYQPPSQQRGVGGTWSKCSIP
jgi:hypothetical protein